MRRMISAVDPDVAETGVAERPKPALTLGKKNIAVAPDADNRNLHARECLAEHRAEVRAEALKPAVSRPGRDSCALKWTKTPPDSEAVT